MYLNEIYFGRGAYGIEAASREYFGKHAAQLTLAEAALLAGLPRAPTPLNPRNNLEQATKGRRTVLNRMAAQHGITSRKRLPLRQHPFASGAAYPPRQQGPVLHPGSSANSRGQPFRGRRSL